MRFDFHLHLEKFHKRNQVEQLLQLCCDRGLQGFVATPHFKRRWLPDGDLARFFAPYDYASRISPRYGVQVLPGAEVRLEDNDYLVYGLEAEEFQPIVKIEKLLDLVAYVGSNGGVVVQAHPFRGKDGVFKHLVNLNVDGFEVQNANHSNSNDLALALAKSMGKIGTRGSDAHRLNDAIGKVWVDIDGFDGSWGSVISGLKGNRP